MHKRLILYHDCQSSGCVSSLLLTTQEQNFQWNFNSAIMHMANSLNFWSTYYKVLTNLTMIAYMTLIQKSKFTKNTKIYCRESDRCGASVRLNFMHVFFYSVGV